MLDGVNGVAVQAPQRVGEVGRGKVVVGKWQGPRVEIAEQICGGGCIALLAGDLAQCLQRIDVAQAMRDAGAVVRGRPASERGLRGAELLESAVDGAACRIETRPRRRSIHGAPAGSAAHATAPRVRRSRRRRSGSERRRSEYPGSRLRPALRATSEPGHRRAPGAVARRRDGPAACSPRASCRAIRRPTRRAGRRSGPVGAANRSLATCGLRVSRRPAKP